MIKCAELNREFETKELLFRALRENKKTIIANKKSEVKTKDNKSVIGFMDMRSHTVKAIPNLDDDYIYPVISNTNYLDSHGDVHLDGSMNRTAKNQSGKVYYVADHKLEVDSVIAMPKDVEILLETCDWSDLGRNYKGTTEAMIFKIAKTNIIHDKFMGMVSKGNDLQNSIRMMYVDLAMAVNSQDPEFKDEYATYLEVYPKIANKDNFDGIDYFFAVKELKIHMEGSAVLFGSNDATPNNIGSSKDTQDKSEPEKSLRERQLEYFLNT